MISNRYPTPNWSTPTRALFTVGLTLACLSLLAASAVAQPIDGSYSVSIGESERVLAAEIQLGRNQITPMQFNSIVFQESCMNPSIRMHLRNKFAISIANTSTSAQQPEITSVDLDLTSLIPTTTTPALVFGNGDIPTDGFNGAFLRNTIYFDDGDGLNDDGVPVVVTATPFANPADPSKITLNFTGLTPGKAIIFRLDLDNNPDDGSNPDYRHGLYGVNVGGSGTTTPAQISAMFAAGGATQATPTVPLSHNFTPEELLALAISPALEPYHSQTQSQMFGQTGRTIIPEPSTAALLLAGLGVLGGRRRNRR